VITLCEQERAELERRAATVTLPFRVVQRARIILYAAEGLQDIDIAARLDCSPDSVGRRRARFVAERLDGLQDQAVRSPASFSPRSRSPRSRRSRASCRPATSCRFRASPGLSYTASSSSAA